MPYRPKPPRAIMRIQPHGSSAAAITHDGCDLDRALSDLDAIMDRRRTRTIPGRNNDPSRSAIHLHVQEKNLLAPGSIRKKVENLAQEGRKWDIIVHVEYDAENP